MSPGGSTQIFIQHSNGEISVYKHMDETNVVLGQEVKKGQIIGEIGDQGSPGAEHLHFEIRPMGSLVQADAVDPIPKLPERSDSITLVDGVVESNGTLVNCTN